MDRINHTRSAVLLGGLLFGVTLAVFWPVVHHEFIIYDDRQYVVRNPHVLGGLSWANAWWALTSACASNWHPLTWLSHMLDVQLFGLKPGWHHLTSLLFHAANSVLLFFFLRHLTGALWRSAFVAALFALHPLHVESFAWVAERKDVLSGCFFLLTLWAYAEYVRRLGGQEKPEVRSPKSEVQNQEQVHCPGSAVTQHAIRSTSPPRNTQHATRWYVLALVFFACGLMSKPMLVTLPFVLLLLDYWPLRRFELSTFNSQPSTFNRFIWEKIPFLALALASSVVTFVAQRSGGAVESLERVPFGARFANAAVAYSDYLRTAVWPFPLAIMYPRPDEWPVWRIGLALAVLAIITALVLRQGRRRRYLAVGWLWFAGMLVPVIGLVQAGNQYRADRYAYLPLIGLFVALTWGGCELATSRRFAKGLVGTAAFLVLAGAGAAARRQAELWKNTETLFGHCLAITSNNHIAHNNLGMVLAEQGKVEQARSHFLEALRIRPHDADTSHNLGVLLTDQGSFDDAAPYLEEAASIKPKFGADYGKLAMALDARGYTEQAIACYRTAVRWQPDLPELCNNLAWLLATRAEERLRDGAEAVRLAEHACKLTGYNQPLLVGTLAAAYAEAGRFPEAVAMAEKARDRARADKLEEAAKRNEQLLELYRTGKAYREGGETVKR